MAFSASSDSLMSKTDNSKSENGKSIIRTCTQKNAVPTHARRDYRYCIL